MIRRITLAVLAATLLLEIGCNGADSTSHYLTNPRKENGLVVILPGIEGESEFNHNIRQGLASAGCYRAMPIYNWGAPIPGVGMLINQTNVIGNRIAGSSIADMIEKYQDNYPGRPVYVIGHSGGGGVAVFTAEAMGEGKKIDGLVLLSASISSDYDLNKALKNCKNGILNVYNPDDTALLGVGTAIMGNVDGGHGASAGQSGFAKSAPGLYQITVGAGMYYGGGSHDASTRPGFVARFVAPWVLSSVWPPNNALSSR